MDPNEILKTNGFLDTCLFLLKEIKNVYGLQGIYIIDKHLEIIIKKMFSFVKIVDSGDTNLIEEDIVYLNDFMNENKKHYNKNVIVNSGDSLNYKKRMLISDVDLSYENSILESKGLKKIEVRKCVCAKAKLILCGISQVSLNSSSFLSSASFQYTIDVLTAAAAARKTDVLSGIKENVVVGHVIPAGTGFKDFKNIDVEYIGNNNR
jgi:DNA-directed RNA polymerase subunit beta'